VSGSSSVQKGWIVQVDNELMPVTGVGSGTVTVVRGYFESQAASHSAARQTNGNRISALRGRIA